MTSLGVLMGNGGRHPNSNSMADFECKYCFLPPSLLFFFFFFFFLDKGEDAPECAPLEKDAMDVCPKAITVKYIYIYIYFFFCKRIEEMSCHHLFNPYDYSVVSYPPSFTYLSVPLTSSSSHIVHGAYAHIAVNLLIHTD